MCKDCGCDLKNSNDEIKIELSKSVTDANDKIAHDIWHSLQEKEVFCINLMGSPGAGKTTFIENISKIIGEDNIAVIQGDLESDVDKARLEKSGIMTFQINTHSGCHLNATMIKDALVNFNVKGKKYLIIENVGNLVCPVGVKIGQHMNMVVSSTTEGSDKPKKYPQIFMESSLIVVSKADIAEHVDFDEEMYMTDIRNINGKAKIIKSSSKTGDGFKEIVHYIEHRREHILGHEHKH